MGVLFKQCIFHGKNGGNNNGIIDVVLTSIQLHYIFFKFSIDLVKIHNSANLYPFHCLVDISTCHGRVDTHGDDSKHDTRLNARVIMVQCQQR